MAIPKFLVDLEVISKLGEYPGSDDNLSTEQFKAKFDEAALRIQEYLNTVLIPELDSIVDVGALLKDILDATLTRSDKAAPAKTVGEKLVQMIHNNAAFFTQTVKSGDYILEADENFRTELLAGNKVRVYGGKYVTQGNLVELNLGTYVELNIESGSVGLYRHDLICARYERDTQGNVTKSIVLIKGSASQTLPVDPGVNTGDINVDGAVIHDTPLRRIVLSQTSITITDILEAQVPVGDRKIETKSVSATLYASGWTPDETSGFIQTIEVAGLTDDKKAKAYPARLDTLAEKLALKEETAKVCASSRSGSSMTFECWEETPTLDIPIIVEVYV